MYYYFVDKINLIAIIMMMISASVIIDNLYRFGQRKGAMINVYISLFACILHYYRFAVLNNINYDLMINLMGVIALTGLSFAIIMEALCVFNEYEVIDKKIVKREFLQTKSVKNSDDSIKSYIADVEKDDMKNIKKTSKKPAQAVNNSNLDIQKISPISKDSTFDDEKTIDDILGDIEARAEKMSKKSKELEVEFSKIS
jgi:hypothetical protein